MGEHKRRHSAGWYAGAAAFWLIALWLVGVGLSSIIPQIFWPEARAAVDADAACAPALRALEGELIGQVGVVFREVPLSPVQVDLETFLVSWDERYVALRFACSGRERAAWEELGRLRHGLVALLGRFDREQLPRIRTIERTLGDAVEAPSNIPR